MDKIPESIQKIVEDYIANLSRQISIEKVILFGSYAKGNTHKDSDVDIAVFSDYFKSMSRVDAIQFLLLRAMDYDIDLELQPFTMDEYKDPVGLVQDILRTGIEIMNPIDFVRREINIDVIEWKKPDVLIKELGYSEFIRFIRQVENNGNEDYLIIQEGIYKGMNIDAIYKQAKEHGTTCEAEQGIST